MARSFDPRLRRIAERAVPAVPPPPAAPTPAASSRAHRYVGTLVGESTSREFRLAINQEAVREQDIIAVDAELRRSDRPSSLADGESDGAATYAVAPSAPVEKERIRVWAKVQRIERLNPLFPAEAGHELAATRTDPFDTVLSLSREMVTAVCTVLGSEPLNGGTGGRLDHLRYPPQPASSAYRPDSTDIARVVLGDLQQRKNRALDLATLSNRPEVDVLVDGHAIVTRHLAILAMTGAGKSVTARRIVEQLAAKNYPIVIFDPHGDYTGLADVPALRPKVKIHYASLPVLDEDADTAQQIIGGLSGETMTAPQSDAFETLFAAVPKLLSKENLESGDLYGVIWEVTRNANVQRFGVARDLFTLAALADTIGILAKKSHTEHHARLAELGFDAIHQVDGRVAGSFRALGRQIRQAAFALRDMERINRARAGAASPLPDDRTSLVRYGQVTVVSLAGYTDVFQATLYSLVARQLFGARVQGTLGYPFVMLLEEAHTFVPHDAEHPALLRSLTTTKQIAQEGRKFGAGLILISQRPSRLDETTLSQCNSYVIMRMVNPADQNFVRRVIETLGEDEARMLPDLDVGEAVLSGQLINFPVLVRIKQPESQGEHEERDAFELLEEARKGAAAGAPSARPAR
jgi:DNA helicase HerA-like ATPase